MINQTILEKEFPQVFGSKQQDIFDQHKEKEIEDLKRRIREGIIRKIDKSDWMPF